MGCLPRCSGYIGTCWKHLVQCSAWKRLHTLVKFTMLLVDQSGSTNSFQRYWTLVGVWTGQPCNAGSACRYLLWLDALKKFQTCASLTSIDRKQLSYCWQGGIPKLNLSKFRHLLFHHPFKHFPTIPSANVLEGCLTCRHARCKDQWDCKTPCWACGHWCAELSKYAQHISTPLIPCVNRTTTQSLARHGRGVSMARGTARF